jgi:hypothetical protein
MTRAATKRPANRVALATSGDMAGVDAEAAPRTFPFVIGRTGNDAGCEAGGGERHLAHRHHGGNRTSLRTGPHQSNATHDRLVYSAHPRAMITWALGPGLRKVYNTSIVVAVRTQNLVATPSRAGSYQVAKRLTRRPGLSVMAREGAPSTP